eukprot:191850-Rhodomonas_salina.2
MIVTVTVLLVTKREVVYSNGHAQDVTRCNRHGALLASNNMKDDQVPHGEPEHGRTRITRSRRQVAWRDGLPASNRCPHTPARPREASGRSPPLAPRTCQSQQHRTTSSHVIQPGYQ